MMFKDEVRIVVKAGKGGAGAATFRREKYIPKGGPDGGDGGKGGNVIIKVNPHLRTLSYLHNNQKFKAEDGGKGLSNKKTGKNGSSLSIEVPAGTIINNADTGGFLADLTENESEFIAARGGIGGKGNVHFKGPTNQTPFYAQKGKSGDEINLALELKMIAHIGLVGFPNSGKSTLISKITNARPKIGNYPFTTLHPNIGIMNSDDSYQSLVIADIPGLIEGANTGKGLGTDFLKHIERTSLILFILDSNDDPENKFKILRKELAGYSINIYNRPYIVALNKIDLTFDEKARLALLAKFKNIAGEVFLISALTGIGLKELKYSLIDKYMEIEKSS